MKRFYKTVSVADAEAGYQLLLDDRPVRTPARAPLVLPTAEMAQSVADEWAGQGEDIVIATMPMTGFANAAIDRILPDRGRFVSDILAYGATDTLCYRADPGDPLATRQQEVWEPILTWSEKRYDIGLVRVAGIIHQPQSQHSLSRLQAVVESFDPSGLAGLTTLASIGGSLIAALALIEKAFDSERIWQAVCLEELWQVELWGTDADAETTRQLRRAAFDDAARFCCMARDANRER
ncbi:ATP12 family chaperone protein [Blastomonas sp.]|uniref:ATP12 family chaperone protein n=1 Tax=Blastomonas sp. TaxID=1909299 RepID=UPI002615423D|nr:ATP12 family protein [Blastomonas sp.]MDM7957241.1 ATP12 family protein [Blastomonas sp.]